MGFRKMAYQEQIACVFCGKSTIKEKLNLEALERFNINWKVIQLRQKLPGPGRGKRGKNPNTGWPLVRDAGLSIVEMASDPSYRPYVEAIKDRLLIIVRAYVEAGIIKRSELKFPKASRE
jgi:hypothetical protein